MRATQISLWRSSFESEASEMNESSQNPLMHPTRCRHSAGCISGFCDDSFISIAVPEPVPGAGSAKLRISSAAFALRFRESKGLLVGSGASLRRLLLDCRLLRGGLFGGRFLCGHLLHRGPFRGLLDRKST